MLTSATSVIERRTVVTEPYGTHPYEAGWASEALFFVQTVGEHPALTIQPQVSPDGITWVDHGGGASLPKDQHLVALEMVRFGMWIRLRVEGGTPETPATLLIHVALKG